MTVIPAINETIFSEIEKKIKSAADFGASWVHLDVSDGRFTENLLWNSPTDLSDVKGQLSGVNLEVHLMVKNPEAVVSDWIGAGAKRIIVHVEAVQDLKSMKDACVSSGVELFVAGNPETSLGEFLKYKYSVDGFLVLAVKPGRAGQKFGENQLEKIKLLREQAPDAKIIVDGGVNLDNAPQIKDAGADILIAASAIWGSADPKDSFKKLQSV